MSEKTTCPGCGSRLSSIRDAFDRDEPCPNCGLSASVALEIMVVQQSRADESLRSQLSEALVRAGRAEAKAQRLEDAIWRIRVVLDDLDGQP